MKFKPLHDRVVVRRVESDTKTKGGIIIPDTAKEKPQEGEVLAVGPGARDETGKLVPLDVKAGDRVLFGKWSGTEVKIDGEDLLIMKESDILGIIEGVAETARKAKSWPSAPAPATNPASASSSTSPSATASCSASGPAPKSASTAKIS